MGMVIRNIKSMKQKIGKELGQNGVECKPISITPRGAKILLKYAFISAPVDVFISYVSHTDKNFKAYKVKNNPYSVLQLTLDYFKTSLGSRFSLKKICPNDNSFYGVFLFAIPILFIIFFIWTLILISRKY